MLQAQIEYLYHKSYNFPEKLNDEVIRESDIKNIEKNFEEYKIIFLKGKDSPGKKTILAQFGRKYNRTAISLFINAYSTDINYLFNDLCDQVNWILGEQTPENLSYDSQYWGSRKLKLSKFAKNSKDRIFFLIDGIDEIPQSGNPIVSTIIDDWLPIDSPNFYFIFSCNTMQDMDRIFKNKKIKYDYFPLHGFSFEETKSYFKDCETLTEDYLKDVYERSSGNPNYLSSIKRLIKTSNDLLDSNTLPNKFDLLFEKEWNQINTNDEKLIDLLSLLAHGNRKKYKYTEIEKILKFPPNIIDGYVKKLNFLMPSHEKTELKYINESFRKYAQKELSESKFKILNLIIDFIILNKSSESQLELPDLFVQTNRYTDLIDYLSPDNFSNLVSSNQSLITLKNQTNLGLIASEKMNNYADILRFNVQNSCLSEISRNEGWKDELEAILSLNDFDSAMSIANSAILKEEKLHILVVIAKYKKEKNKIIDQELIEQIKLLYQQIDEKNKLGEKAIDISADLIYLDTDLAIKLVENSLSDNVGSEYFDKLLHKLYSNNSDSLKKSIPIEIIEKIQDRLTNPKLKNFSKDTRILLEKHSAVELISDLEILEDDKSSLLLIRNWLSINSYRDDIFQVISYGLKRLIRSMNISTSARDFKFLSSPLPYMSNHAEILELLNSFNSQSTKSEELGPTEDYVGFQLNLIHAEFKVNNLTAENRLLEIYFYIDKIHDLLTKTICLANLISVIKTIEENFIINNSLDISNNCNKHFNNYLEDLLNGTASHDKISKDVIQLLSVNNFDLAFRISQSLNTEERRDDGLITLLKTICYQAYKKDNIGQIIKCIDAIQNTSLKENCIIIVIDSLNNWKINSKDFDLNSVKILTNKVKKINSLVERTRAYTLIYQFIQEHDKLNTSYQEEIFELIYSSWSSINDFFEKINSSYKLTAALANYSKDKAIIFMDKAKEIKKTITFSNGSYLNLFILNVRLLIRAYGGLLIEKLDDKDDLNNLISLIKKIPSDLYNLKFYNEIALRFSISKRSDECKSFVIKYLKPMIDNLSDDPKLKNELIINAAPSLFISHVTTCKNYLSTLNKYEKDRAILEIADFIFTKTVGDDPYNSEGHFDFPVTYEELEDICDLLGDIWNDGYLFSLIEKISDCVDSKKKKLTEIQKYSLHKKIKKVIEDNLPNKDNIKHDGYKISCLAYAYRIIDFDRAFDSEMDNLHKETQKISNIADKSLVLGILSYCLKNKDTSKKIQMFEESALYIDTIPSDYDKISRFSQLSELVLLSGVGRAICEKYLLRAYDITKTKKVSNVALLQRRIIDIANRVDSNFAEKLAALSDKDPAKEKSSDVISNRLKLLKITNSIESNQSEKIDISNSENSEYISSAFWKSLGHLNSGRLQPRSYIDALRELKIASQLQLSKAYPILAWIIENSNKMYHSTNDAKRILRENYKALFLNAILSERMVVNFQKSTELYRNSDYHSWDNTNSTMIRPGDQNKANEIITEWIFENAKEFIIISDPYFSPEDLEILKIFQRIKDMINIQIISSIYNHKKLINKNYQEAYEIHWRNISSQEPPQTDITLIGKKVNGKSPLHDRYIITKNAGLIIGTSKNSLGINESVIHKLDASEAYEHEKVLNSYIRRITRDYQGEKLEFISFSL